MPRGEKMMLPSERFVVPLQEGKSIGLELDFSAEESTGRGVRVSRIDAGGTAETRGVCQEDRLIIVGGVDVREAAHVLIREMLLKRTGTIHLEFGRPPPPPPQPRGSASGVTGRNARARSSSSRSWSRGNGAASSSAAHGSDDGPVGTARQRSSNSSNSSRSRSNGAAPSSAARGSNDGHVGTARQSRVAAAPAVLTRRRKTGREEPEQRQDASPSRQQHQLYNRVNSGRVTSSSSAERAAVAALAFLAGTTDPPSTATITAKPLSIRKRRRGSTAAKAPVMLRPRPAHAHGDMLDQLDFLVAQQQKQQQTTHKQGLSLAPPPRRSPPPPPPPGKGRRGGEGGLSAVDIVRQQLREEEEHQQQLEQQRRQQPCQQQQQQQQRQEEEAAAAEAADAANDAADPATLSATDTITKRRRSHRKAAKQKQQQQQQQQQQQKDGGKKAQGGGNNSLNNPSSSSSQPPPAPPPWLDVLLGLEMADFTGTKASRAAVVVGEVREMEAKELMFLRRLHKVEPSMTFEGYAAFRSASLRGPSTAYVDLETLQEQHVKQRQRQEQPEEEEAHQQELADLAMNGSFVSNLLLEGCEPTEPAATAEPSISSASQSSPSSTATSEAGNGSLSNGGHGRIPKYTKSGGGGGGGDDRPSQQRSRRQPQQQQQKDWSPKALSEKDVKIARAQLKTTAERIKFVKESHGDLQAIIRRSLACHEKAVAIADAHRAVRRQCLQDVKETREAGKKTEKKAKEVLGKIRTWEQTARAGEKLALEAAGAATQRAETLRDAVELLMAGMEKQNARMECLAMFRMLNGPMGAACAHS